MNWYLQCSNCDGIITAEDKCFGCGKEYQFTRINREDIEPSEIERKLIEALKKEKGTYGNIRESEK